MELKSGESPPMLNVGKLTPSVRMSASPDETIQVKIDPDDVLPSPNGSQPSSSSSPDIPEEHCVPAEGGGGGGGDREPCQKHCKPCNITFTYMSTFLAHKKYYCSSHSPPDHAPSSSSTSATPPPPPPPPQQATPT